MSYSQLTSEQRYYISQLIGKQSISQIAKDIGCHKSTVSRNRVGIEKRPAIVDSKERIGDWEVDTIVDKDQKSALVVATERKTKLTLIRKIENFKAENTAR